MGALVATVSLRVNDEDVATVRGKQNSARSMKYPFEECGSLRHFEKTETAQFLV